MNIFKIDFWFTSIAIQLSYVVVLVIIFSLMICFGVYLYYLNKSKKNIFDSFVKKLNVKLIDFLITMGIFGLVLTFFYYEGVFIMSWKFWLFLWFLVSIIWFIPILKFYRSISLKRDDRLRFQKFRKYLS